jgi:hypothetical protein
MGKPMGVLSAILVAFVMAGCASSPAMECTMCSKGAAADGKAMSCEKKVASCACCSKGAADGKAAEGHQH